MRRILPTLIAVLTLATTASAQLPPMALGQGTLVGRATMTTAILQTRLTAGNALIDNDLPGLPGVAFFEIARDPDFADARRTPLIEATPENDFIIKTLVEDLAPATTYYFRTVYGPADPPTERGATCTFKTLGGPGHIAPARFAVVTGMNYFFFNEGNYNPESAYQGPDKALGFPGLAAISALEPDYFIATGDTVYFDHPLAREGRWIGTVWKDAARTEAEMRRKYHEQFRQPRFADLFRNTATYWEVDDHDYRYNDCDNTGEQLPLPETGAKNFREQLPVTDPDAPGDLTYGTYRVNRDLQIWLLEGRLYRSPNRDEDKPGKSIWGETQRRWLEQTLLASNATFKMIIAPTPMVGPDGAGKRDSHVNLGGFRTEGDAFFDFLTEHGFQDKNLYILCGDRHWQYHAIHPSGIPEIACGSLVDANSRYGIRAGAANSTDPEGLIKQLYCTLPGEPFNAEPSGGFLMVDVLPRGDSAEARFTLYDEFGTAVYTFAAQAQ